MGSDYRHFTDYMCNNLRRSDPYSRAERNNNKLVVLYFGSYPSRRRVDPRGKFVAPLLQNQKLQPIGECSRRNLPFLDVEKQSEMHFERLSVQFLGQSLL